MKSGRFHRATTLNEEEKSDSLFRPEITSEEENGVWDDWGNWSTCSVTCGNGRRVRWRHCSANNCVKGLKKAQIKTCHLKKCDTNILNWLGIKTR
ncbi:thrombospondin-1-like [Ceratina calcarata]|uniref:Thrombospondin-1-like n=1 Tax=Ceratina calcarata TaxID=156304 RepID=A0AAJ7S2B5_9HYME|nr:thrombospondin-1-like [Ceratina calcarata]